MDRGKDVIADNTLGDQDGILEVVSVPRHKRDQHIPAKCQFAILGRRAVSKNITLAHGIADLDQRALVDGGVLV